MILNTRTNNSRSYTQPYELFLRDDSEITWNKAWTISLDPITLVKDVESTYRRYTMPSQETFLTLKSRDETVEVLKTYDEVYARDVFRNMDDEALAHLAASLKLESLYEESGIPRPAEDGYEDFIWDVMVDNAREDGSTCSYFIVTKSNGRKTEELFVSEDWPTAEAYVKMMRLPETTTSQSPA